MYVHPCTGAQGCHRHQIPLGLELQGLVSCSMWGYWEPNSRVLEKRYALLTLELPFQPLFSLCVCVWVCATGVQVSAEAGERVRSSGARVKTAVSCLALLLGTELGPLKSSNYSNCWVLSPATPPYIDFFLEAGSQVAQTSLSFTVCLRTLNFWSSYLYFPSAVTTGMHPHFVRAALHQLSYMTHPQSLLL